eukprot:scaffold9496_cov135-Isochrysis_galbana.AAC.4
MCRCAPTSICPDHPSLPASRFTNTARCAPGSRTTATAAAPGARTSHNSTRPASTAASNCHPGLKQAERWPWKPEGPTLGSPPPVDGSSSSSPSSERPDTSGRKGGKDAT